MWDIFTCTDNTTLLSDVAWIAKPECCTCSQGQVLLETHCCNVMLLLTESAVHTRNICCDVMPYGPNEVRSVRHDVTTNIFRIYGPNSRLIRALLYTHTSKTTTEVEGGLL